MKFSETAAFTRDFKRLLKKFPSLAEDFATVKRYDIELFHCQKIDIPGIFKIENSGNSENLQFFKIKKFACKSLKNRGAKSGIRVVYSYYCESCQVEFIEIYFKGEKENENRDRIKDYLKNLALSSNL